ncbi:hypothetical protein ACGHBE_004533 [Pseudomonas aeruginosa]|uniref:hypothetical protein n=1 Tax=Pseudomonas aeruginosa TaxID=287 RepID=UPI0024990F6F|nr:hypothetical protein [Pseudomonas aeruginosa]MDI2359828.1 hypothetical protein [Pseudomonas aeruginosa]MDI2365951.1 hypothetical protein [Pseudomonas aeruginosa]
MRRELPERRKIKQRIGYSRWLNELSRQGRSYIPGKNRYRSTVLGREYIRAPKHISIYEIKSVRGARAPYYQTISFLKDIEKRFKVRDCVVDFSQTERISAAALVVVYAAIELAAVGRSGSAQLVFSRRSPGVNSAIKASNLQKLIRGSEISYALDSVRSMPIISSVGSEQMDEIIDFIQRRIYKDAMEPETEHVYADAVSETINNVRLHAYPDCEPHQKRWWLMCHTFGKELYLAIYDNGVGIPKTIVERSWLLSSMKVVQPGEYRKILEVVPDLEKNGMSIYIPTIIPDEKLIFYSMQGDVSGTKQDKHGQGSKSIKKLVSDTDDGLLWVFSNYGLCTFTADDQTPSMSKLKAKFPGTLVQWNIELP